MDITTATIFDRDLGAWLRRCMAEQGRTTAEAAAALGIEVQAVRRQLRGDARMTAKLITAWAEWLDVEVTITLAPATGFEPVTYRFTDSVAA